MIAAFMLFDIPKESVFPAVLTYRLIAFWLPTIPGIIAYFQLRRTSRREGRRAATLQKVKYWRPREEVNGGNPVENVIIVGRARPATQPRSTRRAPI